MQTIIWQPLSGMHKDKIGVKIRSKCGWYEFGGKS